MAAGLDWGVAASVGSTIGSLVMVGTLIYGAGRVRQMIDEVRNDLEGVCADIKHIREENGETRRALHATELIQREHEGRIRVMEAAHAESVVMRREWSAWREAFDRKVTEILTILRGRE